MSDSRAVTRVKTAISAMLGLGADDLPKGLGKLMVISSQDLDPTAQALLSVAPYPLHADARASVEAEQAAGSIAEQTHTSLIATARRDAAQALYDPVSRTTYFIADRIRAGTEQAVFLHEMVHKHGRMLLGTQAYQGLIDQVHAWGQAPAASNEKSIHARAQSRAARSGVVGARFDDEVLAYAVETAVAMGIVPSAAAHAHSAEQWLDTVIASIEQIAADLAHQRAGRRLSLQQVVDLAYALAQVETPAHARRIEQALQGLQSQAWAPQPPQWVSSLAKAIAALPEQSMPAAQWLDLLRGLSTKGVKPDEIAWSGVKEWLALQSTRVAKAQILHYLDAHGVRVEETLYGGPPAWSIDRDRSRWERGAYAIDLSSTGVAHLYLKNNGRTNARVFFGPNALHDAMAAVSSEPEDTSFYGDYVLPGGTNYRELVLTLPSPVQFTSKHWDAPNVLSHIRFNERRDTEDKRVLFIEEIQSDWAAQGRKERFTLVPRAPFVERTSAWVGLSIKRMLRYAAEHNFERLAFISGEQVVQRFNLKRDVQSIHYAPAVQGGKLTVTGYSTGRGNEKPILARAGVKPGELAGLIGFRHAMALMAPDALQPDGARCLSSLFLKMGGSGAIDFYDVIVPAVAAKLVRSLGGQSAVCSEMVLEESQASSDQLAFDITPAMREFALQGLPLFSLQDSEISGEPGEIESACRPCTG